MPARVRHCRFLPTASQGATMLGLRAIPAGARPRVVECSGATASGRSEPLARTYNRDKRLDAIIVCAALQGPVGPAMTLDPKMWSAAVRVNLDGTFHVLRAFAALLRPEGNARAKILCFSGGGASKPRANFSAYAASKTGVVRLVEHWPRNGARRRSTLIDRTRTLPRE